MAARTGGKDVFQNKADALLSPCDPAVIGRSEAVNMLTRSRKNLRQKEQPVERAGRGLLSV